MSIENKKRIIQYLPYVGSFIIFLGVTRLIVYYSSFGINIVGFLEFSEIITSFLDIIVIVTILIIFFSIQVFLMISRKDEERKSRKRELIISATNFWRRLWIYLSIYNMVVFWFPIGYMIASLVWELFKIESFSWQSVLEYFIMSISVFVLAIIHEEVRLQHRRLNTDSVFQNFTSLLFLSIIFIGITLTTTYKEAKVVKSNKGFFNTSVELQDGTKLVSDSLSYYIGKTKNYVFIYNERDTSTNVIPGSTIKNIVFKRKKPK